MKREFLENLELNGTKLTKDLIDQIMAENGKDIAAEQAKLTTKDAELIAANKMIEDMKETAKKFEGTDPGKMKQDLADLQKKYDADLTQTKLNSALDLALVQAKAKDITAAKALLQIGDIKLDGDKLLGLDAQLEGLKKDKEWLFEAVEQTVQPKGPIIKTGLQHGEKTQPEAMSMRDAVQAKYQSSKSE